MEKTVDYTGGHCDQSSEAWIMQQRLAVGSEAPMSFPSLLTGAIFANGYLISSACLSVCLSQNCFEAGFIVHWD